MSSKSMRRRKKEGADEKADAERREEDVRAEPRADEEPLPVRVDLRLEERRAQRVELGVHEGPDAGGPVQGHRERGVAALREEPRHDVRDGVDLRFYQTKESEKQMN